MKVKGCLLPVVVEMGLNNSGIAAGVLNSTDSQESIRILLWESKESCKANSKSTTAILVRPGNTVDSIGIEAELKHYNSKKDKGWFFSKSFMMTLCEREDTDSEDVFIEDIHNETKLDVIFVISAFIEKMKTEILRKIYVKWNTDIQFILTVPPIWKNKEKQLMSTAAEMTGIPLENVILLEEPEAVFKYYSISLNSKQSFKKSQNIVLPESYRCIVLHVGENAISATVMKVEDCTSYTMLNTVFSQYGGVSQEVLNFTNRLFSEKVTKFCKENHPLPYIELLFQIEQKMKSFQPNTDVRIRIPPTWFVIYEHISRRTLSEAIENSSMKSFVKLVADKIKISHKLFRTFYDSFIQKRLPVIKKILAKESVSGISVIFLSGDFIDNVFVDALKQQYPKQTVCVADDPNVVVLKGALMYWNEQVLQSK